MAQYFSIHPQNPQQRLIYQAAEIVRDGGVVALPTDSSYALACQLGNKDAQERIRAIRQVGDTKHFTLLCRNLAELATYARVDNSQFRLLKANTPGSYTFILKASREVPRRLQHPKRSTIGLRVPDHAVTLALLEELDEPLLSMTLILPGEEQPLNEAWEIRERLERQIDLVIPTSSPPSLATITSHMASGVVDLSEDGPELVRRGKGDPAALGLE